MRIRVVLINILNAGYARAVLSIFYIQCPGILKEKYIFNPISHLRKQNQRRSDLLAVPS